MTTATSASTIDPLIKAIAELKQAIANIEVRLTNLEAWMGLAPVASKLPSCPYDVLGFHTVPLPPSLDVEAEAQEERNDRRRSTPSLSRRLWTSLRVVITNINIP
ncbi:hypothetical protein GUJ93_ZPchr0001g30745 [Zizania palustris]|uniref:Uncharacterized protein n=1 Tax=Zizania palustris TaxID=103762 RepID=A0A8J5RTV7_ZIZPA|nr:hypothetical protein GUJ93_ZPchr0001g30745 [Zizania palustris]